MTRPASHSSSAWRTPRFVRLVLACVCMPHDACKGFVFQGEECSPVHILEVVRLRQCSSVPCLQVLEVDTVDAEELPFDAFWQRYVVSRNSGPRPTL